jgi:hypothetical protein
MWVRFSKNFDWHVGDDRQTIVAFTAGRAYSVTAKCAAAAAKAKAAKRITSPRKGVDPNAQTPAPAPAPVSAPASEVDAAS